MRNSRTIGVIQQILGRFVTGQRRDFAELVLLVWVLEKGFWY